MSAIAAKNVKNVKSAIDSSKISREGIRIHSILHCKPMNTEKKVLKPLFPYAGNKFEVAEKFRHLYDRNRRYVAPFCGGLGDALKIQPRTALLNDYSAAIVNVYKCLKRSDFEFSLHGKGTKEYYYDLRDEFNAISFGGTTDTRRAVEFLALTLEKLGASKGKNKKKCAQLIEMYEAFVCKEASLTQEQKRQRDIRWAELTYYLLVSGYNGLLRTNLFGEVNVPCGRPWKEGEERKYLEDFSPYKEVFKNWEFQSLPFEKVKVEKNDFVYLDPPYAPDPTAQKKPHTYSCPFHWSDQVRLAEWAQKLTVPVVASNAGTPEVVDLWLSKGFQVLETFGKKRLISQNKEEREVAAEVLFYKK